MNSFRSEIEPAQQDHAISHYDPKTAPTSITRTMLEKLVINSTVLILPRPEITAFNIRQDSMRSRWLGQRSFSTKLYARCPVVSCGIFSLKENANTVKTSMRLLVRRPCACKTFTMPVCVPACLPACMPAFPGFLPASLPCPTPPTLPCPAP
jgi:hypothetical protein